MELNTVSAVMGFAKKLEDDATRVYGQLAEKYPDKKEIFLTFAKEGEKIKTQFSRGRSVRWSCHMKQYDQL